MKTFEQFLEQAKASEGDLEDYRADVDDKDEKEKIYQSIRTTSKIPFEKNWSEYGQIADNNNIKYSVYRSGDSYCVATKSKKDDKEYYLSILDIQLEEENNIGIKFNLKNPYKVKEIIVIPKYRGAGLSSSLYKLFIKKGINLIGDSEQFFGARKLWAKLSKEHDVFVDIIDIKDGSYIEKNSIINHGELDGDFDKRVWTRDDSKWNIRLLLKDIK